MRGKLAFGICLTLFAAGVYVNNADADSTGRVDTTAVHRSGTPDASYEGGHIAVYGNSRLYGPVISDGGFYLKTAGNSSRATLVQNAKGGSSLSLCPVNGCTDTARLAYIESGTDTSTAGYYYGGTRFYGPAGFSGNFAGSAAFTDTITTDGGVLANAAIVGQSNITGDSLTSIHDITGGNCFMKNDTDVTGDGGYPGSVGCKDESGFGQVLIIGSMDPSWRGVYIGANKVLGTRCAYVGDSDGGVDSTTTALNALLECARTNHGFVDPTP